MSAPVLSSSLRLFLVILTLVAGGAVFESLFSRPDSIPLRLGISPWPTDEFLALAHEKGFYTEEGLDVTIIRFGTVQDLRQAFERGELNAMSVSIIDMVVGRANIHRGLRVALVTDHSNGADVILARNAIKDVKALRGKKVGVEPESLGLVILARALEKVGLSLGDVDLHYLDLTAMTKAIDSKNVDAVVTYPPLSLDLQRRYDINVLFTTQQIPREIVDVLAVDEQLLLKNPRLTAALQRVWEKTLAYVKANPAESYARMAQRESVTTEEFRQSLDGIKILSVTEQNDIIKSRLEKTIDLVMAVMTQTNNYRFTNIKPADFLPPAEGQKSY